MANVAISEKSFTVLELLKAHKGENMTSADISEMLGGEEAGFAKKSVEGIVTSGLQRKGYAERVPAQIEVTDDEGNTKYKDVKFIQATQAGLDYDHEAALATDAEAKAAKAKKSDEE